MPGDLPACQLAPWPPCADAGGEEMEAGSGMAATPGTTPALVDFFICLLNQHSGFSLQWERYKALQHHPKGYVQPYWPCCPSLSLLLRDSGQVGFLSQVCNPSSRRLRQEGYKLEPILGSLTLWDPISKTNKQEKNVKNRTRDEAQCESLKVTRK